MGLNRRGRPSGVDSGDTRRRIIDSARLNFCHSGYSGATVAGISRDARLAPSAVYHHFGGKADLYEQVFEATSDAIWAYTNEGIFGAKTLRSAIKELVDHSVLIAEHFPYYSNFLAMVPMEIALHPQFAHLMDRRAKHQDYTFTRLADLGLSTGELAGFERDVAIEILRSAVMGWFFERHFRATQIPEGDAALIALFERLSLGRS
ncbi:MAG: TetR/AcrR family transcriptional regulator [Actinomycetota bacterium]|nr:TetR/AcrR family transcriptional regulator [Actinomycetota bacterium]